jgi:hypothetical protein
MDGEKPIAACANCLAFQARDGVKPLAGQCKRNPPTPMLIPARIIGVGARGDPEVASAWPPVQGDDYCISFVPNAELQAHLTQMQGATKQ